jgi:1-acyl-sn-glycerol-3-phosphate acyltransferase
MAHNQFELLKQRRFLPFFLTQALGAFNDNVFKNALVVMIAFGMATLGEQQRHAYANLTAGLFILPFFLFSATSGQLSERYDKARLAELVKWMEIAIMAVAALGFVAGNIPLLMACVFGMGLHSTLFGPLKYSLLPQVLRPEELTGGNGLVEMGTFVAILAGTILGAVLIKLEPGGAWWVSGAILLIAVAGLFTARAMPALPPTAPDLKINWNPVSETARTLRYVMGQRTVFLSCLGISWFWFFGSMYFVQLPAYAKEVLGGTNHAFTALLAIFSIGVAIGSLLCEKLSHRTVEIGLVPLGAFGMTVFGVDLYFAHPQSAGELGLGLGELLQRPSMWRVALDLALMAVSSGLFIVPLFALVQSRTDRDKVSRVIAANNILNAAFMVVASLLAVLLLNQAGFSVPQLFLLTAVLNALVALYIFSLVPEFLMRFLSWAIVKALYRTRTLGIEEHVPDEGAALVVCNHVSYVDALVVMGAVPRPVRFVMYYKIFRIPLLSWIFRNARAIPIAGAREDPQVMQAAFAEVAKALEAGEIVGIFPEGRLTVDGAIAPFKPGVERILKTHPVPVVPMALKGLWESMFSKRDSRLGRMRLPRRFRAQVELEAAPAVPGSEASAAGLEAIVRRLRGERA